MQGQPTWASMASQPTKPRQTSHPKPGKPMLQKPTPQGTSTDSQCLIIQVHPSISMDERPNGIDTRRKINEMLERKEVPQYFQVMAVRYSGTGNIKITTTHMCKATDLMPHGKDITEIITPNKILSILPDTEHHRCQGASETGDMLCPSTHGAPMYLWNGHSRGWIPAGCLGRNEKKAVFSFCSSLV